MIGHVDSANEPRLDLLYEPPIPPRDSGHAGSRKGGPELPDGALQAVVRLFRHGRPSAGVGRISDHCSNGPPAENTKRIVAAYERGGYTASLKSFAGSHFGVNYPGSLVDGARCMIFAGNRAGAKHFLERAYRAKEGWMIFVPTDPAFDSLRSDPRFARLVHQVLPVSGRSS